MSKLIGEYEGEGANVTSPPAVSAETDAGTYAPRNEHALKVDRRRRLRTSSEAARQATAISVGGGDQVLAGKASRAVYITTAGNLAVRLVDDTSDVTLTGLLAGVVYPFAIAIVRNSSTTAAGFLLF